MSDRAVEEVFLPEQVRRQAARAEELRRELAGEPVDDAEDANTPSGELTEGVEQPSQHEPTTGSEPVEPSGTEWEQRYRTLQGKYDSEVGAMRGQIGAMERLLATMQQPAQQPAAPPPPPIRGASYNEEDVELYGEDLLQAASRAAEAKFGRTIADLQNQVRQLSGRQEEDRVFRELDADPELAGRWRQLNTDQKFLDWLASVDDMAGLSRNTMLQHAYQSGDAMRTGRFFKKYMAEQTTASLPPPMPPQTVAAPARFNGGNGYAAAGGPRLEDMAAPGRAAGSGAGNGAPQARLWSRPEITAFYRARTMGRYKGREAEADQLEADLLRASEEGRLV